ncbi:hypothetical protein B7494_g2827 [Chlorociboria aeruginascens]|nr:hypothetical protein B7494_g2827 [Chlorociboria aeruginascens]
MSASEAAEIAALEALIAYEKAHYDDNRSPALLAGTIIVMVVMILAFLLRLYARKMAGNVNTIDMWLLLVGMIFAIALDVATIVAIHAGLGKHQYRTNFEDPHPPSRTIRIFKAGYACDILSQLSITFIKLAILTFYSRVFTLRQRAFRIALQIMIIYTIGLGFSGTITLILLCNPPRYFWYRAYALNLIPPPFELEGSCLNNLVTVGLLLAFDLLEDVFLFIMPIFALWGLQMTKRKKFGVFLAFGVGGFVVGTNVIRIYYTFRITNSGDLSYSNANAFIWTACQCSIGVVSASIPAMAPLFKLASSSINSRRKHASSYNRFANGSDKYGSAYGDGTLRTRPEAATTNIGMNVFGMAPGAIGELDAESTKNLAQEMSDENYRPYTDRSI